MSEAVAKSVDLDGVKVNYFLEKRKVRYSRLEFRSGKLFIILSKYSGNESGLLQRKKRWILKRWVKIQSIMDSLRGDSMPIFGNNFEIIPSNKFRLDASNKKLHMDVNNPRHKSRVRNVLKKILIMEIESILGKYKHITKGDDISISIRRQRTRWASCSPSQRNMSFNLRLVFQSRDIVEYIVYHEIAHLRHISHNKSFWSLVGKRYSNYKEYERRLFDCWIMGQKCMDMIV